MAPAFAILTIVFFVLCYSNGVQSKGKCPVEMEPEDKEYYLGILVDRKNELVNCIQVRKYASFSNTYNIRVY